MTHGSTQHLSPEEARVRRARRMNMAMFVGALFVGASFQIQAGINGHLAHYLGGFLRAALVSVGVAFLILAILAVLFARSTNAIGVASAPWWIWLGGVFGAFALAFSAAAAPRLGAIALALGIVAGQLLVSLPLDRFGLLGYGHQPVTARRLAGVGLVVVGVLLARL